jgi:hypothetical protein
MELIERAHERLPMRVLAYCLMPNHGINEDILVFLKNQNVPIYADCLSGEHVLTFAHGPNSPSIRWWHLLPRHQPW